MATKTFHRGLRDLKIADYNSQGSWGTAYDILGARSMSVELVVETDELRGDDVVLDRYSKIIAATFRIEHASVDLQTLEMLTGGTLVSNASYEDVLIGEDDNIPYVGIAGRSMGSTTYDLHIFAPKAKMSGNLQYQAQLDTYLIPQAEFQAVSDGASQGILRLRKFPAPTALEIPLRTTTGGL